MFIIKNVKCAFCHFLFPSVIYWYDSGLHSLTRLTRLVRTGCLNINSADAAQFSNRLKSLNAASLT